MLATLGYLSGIFTAVGYVPYIRDMFLKKTKPQRTSWFIWSVLGSIAFFSQLAKGASASLWLPGVETAGVLIIFLLSIKYGVGGVHKKDFITLLFAALGLLLWYVTKEAAFALYIVIFIDALGSFLTIQKAYEDPKSETQSIWILVTIGGLFSILSVGTLDVILLSYPVFIFASNFAVFLAIRLGFRKKH